MTTYYDRNLRVWEHNNKILGEVADVIFKTNLLIWEDNAEEYVTSHGQQSLLKFKESLGSFLSDQYQSPVDRDNLTAAYGASQTLSMILNLLAKPGTLAFVEDVTFYSCKEIIEDHGCNLVPVTLGKHGIDTKDLERLFEVHIAGKTFSSTYNGILYLIPYIHNPTAVVYSEENCKEIVRLARKHNVLVICDDVYNMVLYNDAIPSRMFGLDKRNDVDYGIGHVISSGTFSKILTPALRFGWIEAPKWIVELVETRYGSIAPHLQVLTRNLLDRGLFQPFFEKLKAFYKDRMEKFCERLNKGLPENMPVCKPQGGFFVWYQAPGIDMNELLEYCKQKHNLSFHIGNTYSFHGNKKDCARLSIPTPDDDQLMVMADNFATAVRHFVSKK